MRKGGGNWSLVVSCDVLERQREEGDKVGNDGLFGAFIFVFK